MMKLKCSSFPGYCVGLLLFQVMISKSEKWTVTTPTGHLMATVGGQAELSCQLSPPQNAKHMEVCWFKGDQPKLVHLYRDSHEVNGEAAPEYVDRTEFVKEAIGEGKVTLRLHNISVSDNGPYQCSFKDGDFSDVASMNLSVAALGLETQIQIQAPGKNGLTVECNSGGWFPQPQMEWRDSKGEVVPHLSKSYSQDGAGLFHMKMTLTLKNKSQGNMICYIRNPLISEGKKTNIILADNLFEPLHIPMQVLSSILCVILILILLYCLCFTPKCNCYNKDEIVTRLRCCLLPSKTKTQESIRNCVHWLSSILVPFLGFGVSLVLMVTMYLPLRSRVSISDPLFALYNDWIWDICMLTLVLMVFFSIVIGLLYLSLKEGRVSKRSNSETNLSRYDPHNVDMENISQQMIQVLQ